MGEYADMAIDAGFSCWSDEEPDEYIGRPFRRRMPTYKTCRRCGEDRLFWSQTDKGWRLFKASAFSPTEHKCAPLDAPASPIPGGYEPKANEPKETNHD
jgi:hypothetical protein